MWRDVYVWRVEGGGLFKPGALKVDDLDPRDAKYHEGEADGGLWTTAVLSAEV